jgi:thiol-disulfide isomerase/thioredoxin
VDRGQRERYNMPMLIEFYGQECGHCMTMMPLVEQIEKELGITIEKLETWHHPENAHKQEEYDKGICGGVPFFFNTETKAAICGEADYETLKAWASGGPGNV